MFYGTYNGVEWLRDGSRVREIFGDKLPSRSVVHRGAKRLPMSYLREVNLTMIQRFSTMPVVVVVDAMASGCESAAHGMTFVSDARTCVKKT